MNWTMRIRPYADGRMMLVEKNHNWTDGGLNEKIGAIVFSRSEAETLRDLLTTALETNEVTWK